MPYVCRARLHLMDEAEHTERAWWVIAKLLDSAAECAVHSMLEAGEDYTTLGLNVYFTRRIKLNTDPVRCQGTLLSMSRQVATAERRPLNDQGRLFAHATTTCLVPNVLRVPLQSQ